MNLQEIVDLCGRLESEFDTSQWSFEDIDVWPLVRYELYNRNFYMYRRAAEERGHPTHLDRARRVLRGAGQSIRTASTNVFKPRETDVVFYSDGVSFSDLAGTSIDRFIDPLVDAIAGSYRSEVWVPFGHASRVRSSGIDVQGWIDAANLAGYAATTGLRSPAPAEFERASRRASELHPEIRFPTWAQLVTSARYVAICAGLYKVWLRRCGARVGFVVCYYGGERMAFVWACKQLGIPSVDLQHGYAGTAHWAYSNWQNIPRRGFALLPTYFWTWGETERDHIRKWSDRSAGWHQPIVGGVPSLLEWTHLSQRAAEVDRRVKSRIGNKTAWVYTLNGYETRELLERLASLVAASPDVFWWIRLHPAAPQQQPEVLDAMRRISKSDNWDVETASAVPLPALLRNATLHVTEASSSILDATALGVPSVGIASLDIAAFTAFQAAGWLRTTDWTEALQSCREQANAGPQLRNSAPRVIGSDSGPREIVNEIVSWEPPEKNAA
jgi:hypothetical protein